MKNKIFSLFALSVFALVLLVSGVSAASLAEWSLTAGASGVSYDISKITIGAITYENVDLVGYGINGSTSNNWPATLTASNHIEFTLSALTGSNFIIKSISFNHLTNDTTDMKFDVNYSKNTFTTSTNLVSGGVSTTTSASSSTPTNIALNAGETLTFSIYGYNALSAATLFSIKNLVVDGELIPSEITDSNAIGKTGGLTVRRIDFTNNGLSSDRTFGEDDQWFPFEEIETAITIENNGAYDVSDIELSWGLWSIDEKDWVIDFDKEDEFNLDKDDENTVVVNFKIDNKMNLDLERLTDGDNYRLYVVATGVIDDNDAGSLDGDETSVSDFEPVSIIIENDFVILDNFQVPESVQCKEKVTLTAEAWNVGSDQDEVFVRVYNKELGISKDIPLGDMNAFDRVALNFDMTVPANAAEKTYLLTFTVYNEDSEVYQNDFSDDEALFSVPLAVKGSCVYATATTTYVNVELSSGGKAGQPLVLTATIANLGDKTVDYTFKLNGYTSWASLSDVVPSNLTLAAGETQEVTITLDVNKDASGEKTFNFETYSGGSLVTKQPLSATITSGFSFASITGGAVGSITPLIIGLLSVILVVVILIVLVKVAKK